MCIRKDAVFHSKANAIYSVMHTKNKRMTHIVHTPLEENLEQ